MIPSVLSIAFMANARDVETRIHEFLGLSQSMKEMEGADDDGEVEEPWEVQKKRGFKKTKKKGGKKACSTTKVYDCDCVDLKDNTQKHYCEFPNKCQDGTCNPPPAPASWITQKSKGNKTVQQAKVLNEVKVLDAAKIVYKRRDWAGDFLNNYGYAPHSFCKQDSSSCPEGFGSSCYVTVYGCKRKWEVEGDEKCSELPKPDHNKWLTSFLDPSTLASDGELRIADETYCNEYKCTKDTDGVCRDVNDADRNAKKAAGNMFGGYSKESLDKLIKSGTAQGLFDQKQKAEAYRGPIEWEKVIKRKHVVPSRDMKRKMAVFQDQQREE